MGMVNVHNLGFGGSGIPDALPKAIAELQNLRLTFVDGAAAGTVMPVAGMDPEDNIGSVLDFTGQTTINPATISVAGRNASGVITCLETAADGDTVVVNGRTHTFKNVHVHPSYNAPPGVVPITIGPSGTDPEVMADRLSKAIMSGDSSVTAAVESDGASPPMMTKVRVSVRQPGTAGNAYTLSETGAAVTVSGATFTGGVAEAESGFKSTANLAGKKLLVLWYDKNPGVATAPLEMEAGEAAAASAEKTTASTPVKTAKNLKITK